MKVCFNQGRPCLLCEYAHTEVNTMQTNSRVVLQNSHWVALVPWWAVWPFEILRMCAGPCLSCFRPTFSKSCLTAGISRPSTALPLPRNFILQKYLPNSQYATTTYSTAHLRTRWEFINNQYPQSILRMREISRTFTSILILLS